MSRLLTIWTSAQHWAYTGLLRHVYWLTWEPYVACVSRMSNLANRRRRTSFGLMLGQRRRRWPSIKPKLAHCYSLWHNVHLTLFLHHSTLGQATDGATYNRSHNKNKSVQFRFFGLLRMCVSPHNINYK